MGACSSTGSKPQIGRGAGLNSRGLKIARPYNTYEHQLELDIRQASVYLSNFKDIKECVDALKISMLNSGEEKRALFREMISRMGKVESSMIIEKSSSSSLFQLGSLIKCLDAAGSALGVLDRIENGVHWYAKEVHRLNELFMGYIQKQTPLAWEKLFSSAFNLAIFLKYANFEDIDVAYQQFCTTNLHRNAYGDLELDEGFIKLFEHTKSVYSAPVISREQVSAIMSDDSPAGDSYTQVLSLLERQGDSLEGDLKLVYKLCIAWIRHFNRDSDIKFPVPPRNVQIINMMCISEWIKGTLKIEGPNSFSWSTFTTAATTTTEGNGRCLITQVPIESRM
jgi:hypothetical protein